MESYNKHIKELPTGPKYVTMQMCTRFLEENVFQAKMKMTTRHDPTKYQGEGSKSVENMLFVDVPPLDEKFCPALPVFWKNPIRK